MVKVLEQKRQRIHPRSHVLTGLAFVKIAKIGPENVVGDGIVALQGFSFRISF